MNPVKRVKDYLEYKIHNIAWEVTFENYCKEAFSWPITEENKRKMALFDIGIDTHRKVFIKYMDKYHPHPKA